MEELSCKGRGGGFVGILKLKGKFKVQKKITREVRVRKERGVR